MLLSQRDKRWGDVTLGNTPFKVSRWGCTVVSLAMATGYYPPYRDPAYLAKNLRFTADGLLIWGSIPTCTAFTLEKRFYGQQDAIIKEALSNPEKVVLIQVENYHWMLCLGRRLFGGYTAADPWTGQKISVFSRYKNISGGAVLKIK